MPADCDGVFSQVVNSVPALALQHNGMGIQIWLVTCLYGYMLHAQIVVEVFSHEPEKGRQLGAAIDLLGM